MRLFDQPPSTRVEYAIPQSAVNEKILDAMMVSCVLTLFVCAIGFLLLISYQEEEE